MPSEDGLRRHDSRKLREQLSAEQDAFGGEAAATIISEAQALPADVLLE
jgi:hypothetical protein